MSAPVTSPPVTTSRAGALRTAGIAALAAGLAHALFAGAGAVLSALSAPLQSLDYPASLVADFRMLGLVQALLVFIWGAALTAAVIAVGALALSTDRFSGRFATAMGIVGGGTIVLSSGITIAMYSGATVDISATGADIGAQQAVMQGAWVINHACWYVGILAIAVWLAFFAVAARRNGTFGTLALVLSFLVVLSVVALTIALPYPTVGLALSLYLLVLGIVLLARARRARTAD